MFQYSNRIVHIPLISRCFPIFILILLLAGYANRMQKMNSETEIFDDRFANDSHAPKLVLSAQRYIGFTPLRVTFKAELQNVSNKDLDFACLQQAWMFGDGSMSAETPNCVGLDSDFSADNFYLAEHVYDRAGIYEIRFVLGKAQVLSNRVAITVISR